MQRIPRVRKEVQRNGPISTDRPKSSLNEFSGPFPMHCPPWQIFSRPLVRNVTDAGGFAV